MAMHLSERERARMEADRRRGEQRLQQHADEERARKFLDADARQRYDAGRRFDLSAVPQQQPPARTTTTTDTEPRTISAAADAVPTRARGHRESVAPASAEFAAAIEREIDAICSRPGERRTRAEVRREARLEVERTQPDLVRRYRKEYQAVQRHEVLDGPRDLPVG